MKPNIVLGRQIEHYVHCSFMAMTAEQMETTRNAWLSCQLADRPDHDNDACRAVHRSTLRKMHDVFAPRA